MVTVQPAPGRTLGGAEGEGRREGEGRAGHARAVAGLLEEPGAGLGGAAPSIPPHPTLAHMDKRSFAQYRPISHTCTGLNRGFNPLSKIRLDRRFQKWVERAF